MQHVIYKYKLFPLDLEGTDASNITVINYGPNTMKTRAVVMSIIYLISLNLICVKDLSGFRYIGIANIFIYAFVMILIIVQFYPIRSYYMLEKNYDIDYFYNEPKLCWASGFATILLAFLSHPTFFNIRDE